MKNRVHGMVLAAGLLAAGVLTALFITACPDPNNETTGNNSGGPLTAIAITPAAKTLTVNQEFTLTLEKTPANGTGTIEWTSADNTKVTVTNTGKIKGIAVTTAAVTITAKVQGSDTISAACAVSVSEALELKLSTNAAQGADMTDSSEPTRELPTPASGIYAINSYYLATNSKLPDSSSGFKDATFVYIDKQLTGNFKFSVRARMTATPATPSTAKGIVIGAFTPVSSGGAEGIAETSKAGGIVYRCSGGSGALPYALRSMVSKPSEQGSVGGLNTMVGKTDEYIFEVTRTEGGYTTTVFVSKNGDQVETATVAYTDRATELGADKPVYAGMAFAAVKAEISQISLWIDDLDGDPVYYSGDSAAAAVSVAGIKIGVQGADAGAVTGTGTADSPAVYIARQSAVSGGIQLVPEVIPSYADNTQVKYYIYSPSPNTTGITVNETTGLVSATGTGTATIQAISQDVAEPEFYLTITVTADYVPVDDFAIVASPDKTTIIQDIETLVLSTDISATVTNPVITWTSSDAAKILFVTGTGDDETTVATVTGASAKIKGIAAGTATITATAVTTNAGTPTTKTATLNLTVSAGGGGGEDVFWNFSDTAFTSLATPIVSEVSVNGLTIIASSAKNMIHNGNAKTLDEISFTERLQLQGTGSRTERALKFVVTGACVIKVYGISGNSSNARPLVLASETETIETQTIAGDVIYRKDYTYTGSAGTLYLYSGDSGINLYGIKVEY